MVSMQRPCAHAETDASLVAGPGRTLTSVRPLLPTRRTGRAAARPGRNLLHQPSAASRNQTHFLNMRKQRQQSDGRYKMILCSLRFLLFNKIFLKWQDFTVLDCGDQERADFDRLAPHYGWMERLLAGRKLQRCRAAFLQTIPAPRRALVAGPAAGS